MDQDEVVSEASFADGLSRVATGTPLPASEPQEVVEEVVVAEPVEPEYVQVTKDEWNLLKASAARIDEIAATHANIKDTAYGRLGRIETRLQDLQKGGSGVTDEDLAQLAEQYPDLAELSVFKNLRAPNAAPALDEAQIVPLVDQRVTVAREEIERASERKFEMRLLQRDHPDWRAVVGMPAKAGDPIQQTEYRKWLASQSADYSQQVSNSWDADVIGESIKKFKTHSKAVADKTVTAAARNSRIAASVPVKSEGAATHSSGKSEFQIGLERARGR